MTSRSRRATLAILALPLLLAACTTAAPAPTTTPAELTGTRRAVQDVIPAAEHARRTQLQRAATADIRRLEIYPKTYLTTQPGPAAYYLKGYAADGTDLGVIDPNLITVTAQPGATLTSAARDQSVLDVTPDGTTRLTTFTVTLKDRPDVTTHGSVELVTLQPDVTEIPDTSVLFPKANLDAAVLTPDVLAAATAPVTSDEMRAAIESLSDTVPEIPVVLRGVTVTPGDKVALLGLTGQYGTVTRVTAQHDGVSVVIITPDLPDAFFAVYERNPLGSGSVWDAGQTDQPAPSGGLTAQAAATSPCTVEAPGLTYEPLIQGPKLSSFGLDDGLKLSAKFESKLQLAATAQAGFECNWNPADFGIIPLPGVLSALMTVKWGVAAKLSGEATVEGSALDLGYTDTYDFPILPAGPPTHTTDNGFGLIGSPDLLDVDGPAASAKVTLDAFPHFRITLVPGNAFMTKAINFTAKTVHAANFLQLMDPQRFSAIQFRAGVAVEASASAYSMRTVVQDEENPALALTPKARLEVEASGWLFTKLKTYPIFAQVPISGTLLDLDLPGLSSTVPTLKDPTVSDQPGAGTAQVTLGWEEADAGVTRVQLAATPSNGLHGDQLTAQGGWVSYLPSECTGQNRLSAKIFAVAPIRVKDRPFGLGLPFATEKTIGVCTTGIQVIANVGTNGATSGTTYAGARVQVSARILNGAPEAATAGVTWKATRGEVKQDPTDNNWYWTAPFQNLDGAKDTLTATSVYDTTKSSAVTISVTPVKVQASVCCNGSLSGSTYAGGRVQLATFITNASEAAVKEGVTWSTTYGTLIKGTAEGEMYWQAPLENKDGATATVRAFSNADPARSGALTISVTPLVVQASICCNGSRTGSTYAGGRVKLTTFIVNASEVATQQGVTWSASYGTLIKDPSDGFMYWQAPLENKDGATATVTATSVADPARSGTASISVTPLTIKATLGNNGYTLINTYAGGTVILNAPITNASQEAVDKGVTWKTNYGTISKNSAGQTVWTAPLANPDGAKATVTATSVADPARSAEAAITVTPLTVRATVGGNGYTSTNTYAGGSVVLNAGFLNASQDAINKGVTWTTNYGTISKNSAGQTVWTAPLANPDGAKATVTATSVADPARSGSASITVTPLTVKATFGYNGPVSTTLSSGSSTQLYAMFSNASSAAVQQGVTWSATGGTLRTDASGNVYWIAPTVSASTTYTITSVSNADPGRSATATVTVVPRTP